MPRPAGSSATSPTCSPRSRPTGTTSTASSPTVAYRGRLRQARAADGESLLNMPDVTRSTRRSIYGVDVKYPMRGLWPAGATAEACRRRLLAGDPRRPPGHHLQDPRPGRDPGQHRRDHLQPRPAGHGRAPGRGHALRVAGREHHQLRPGDRGSRYPFAVLHSTRLQDAGAVAAVKVDPTPDEHNTAHGRSTSGKPTTRRPIGERSGPRRSQVVRGED
jgi:hypothetical protein